MAKVTAVEVHDPTGRSDPNCLHCAIRDKVMARIAETDPGSVIAELLQNVGEVIGSFCDDKNLGAWIEVSQERLGREARKAAEAFVSIKKGRPDG